MKHALLFLLGAAALAAQEPSNQFHIRVGKQIQGTETYTVTKTPQGFQFNGQTHLQVGGSSHQFTHELWLSPDRNLLQYRLEVQFPGGTQVVEAKRDGEQILLQAKAGGQSPSKTVAFHSGMFVLDNMVIAHYQALFDGLPPKTESVALEILVPQQMIVVKGKLQAAGEEPATLDGKPVAARKYNLDIAGLRHEIWVAANQLMRVAAPIKDLDFTREGFALIPRDEAKETSACVERNLKFPSGDLQVPATLCLPAGAQGRVPVIVLVHGSGPHDRDETIGPNKPFRDLAQGLAAAGIATLRYDKRTFAFPKSFGPKATVEEEVLADAVAALAYVRTVPEVDPKQTFVLGHSLGATLVPFILERAPETRGGILLASAGRPFDELMLEQVTFQGQAFGETQGDTAGEVAKLKAELARIRSGEAADTEMLMATPAYYWRDLFHRDPLAAWKKLNVPVLVLQGGQDVQVRRADYDALVAVLGSKCEPHFLPTLNHLFMPVEGKATGAEYGSANHVDPQVIQLVAKWVKRS